MAAGFIGAAGFVALLSLLARTCAPLTNEEGGPEALLLLLGEIETIKAQM